MKKILIAYQTKTGTTKEAAEWIKSVFEERQFEVDVKALDDVSSLAGYSGVIIGAPINGFRWIPEATQFVETHKDHLVQMPTALYAMNYVGQTGRPKIRATIEKSFLTPKDSIHPKDVAMFGGRIDKEMPLFARLLFGIKKGNPIDLMNPEMVKAWANKMTQVF